MPQPNAHRYFITATQNKTVTQQLTDFFKEKYSPEDLIRAGAVWLEKRRVVDGNQLLKKGDTLLVYVAKNQFRKWALDPARVVFENGDFLVVDKPAEVNTVPERSGVNHNLTHGVQAYLRSRGCGYPSVAIHRLDYGVRGLILFAKTKDAEKGLFELIRKRRIFKSYRAALGGQDMPNCLRLCDKIHCVATTSHNDIDGKVAKSLFMKTAETFRDYSVYRVVISTGRRHQIRFHASHYLAPILGDKQYGSTFRLPGQRIALVADVLRFSWKGKRIRLAIPEAFSEL